MYNMSYVRFENTSGALQECLEEMDNAADFDALDLTDSERRAFERMVEQCREFVRLAEKIDRASE